MQDYEKLGVFYLGRNYDLAAKQAQDGLLLYDSRDLVTHAVVLGMTGSGKTGLCIDMIEEAAIDGIPSILIDPKGDLANLLLTFPQLRGEDFLPWVNPDDASRQGLSAADFAAQQAASWQKGLESWGQDGARIQRLRDAADFIVYTPGSSAGIPVSILKSFAAPAFEILDDGELFKERITTTVTSLLGMLGIQADPMMSREHILLSTIIAQVWQQGQDLDLAALITLVQNPTITKVGVLDIESFYPAKERFALVMALNNLLASPGFGAWLQGAELDMAKMLYTPQGKPRVAIFSIAHLDDAARMFFVSLLLNQFLAWMRTQPGTTSLRALLYMDEIFGYFPPVSNPPSKQPLLTLLKQARAYGVGVVLATQNPVDLDYKGLSNTGTWFIGRLQTERDKARVIEGLEGAAAATGSSFDRANMEQILAGLGSRVFLMNNTHEDAPVIFQTRWSLAYLRGPLTRSQIKQLMDVYKAKPALPVAEPVRSAPAAQPAPAVSEPSTPAISGSPAPHSVAPVAVPAPATPTPGGPQPALPAGISQFFVPVRGSAVGVLYQPVLAGAARVHFADSKLKVDTFVDVLALTRVSDQAVPVDWAASQAADFALNDLEKIPQPAARFGDLPAPAAQARYYTTWTRDFSTWVYGSQKLDLLRSPSTGLASAPAESESAFRARLQQTAREQRDRAMDVLRQKYAPRLATLQEKIRKAQQGVEREAAQAKQAEMQTVISVGATLLGAFMGRKSSALSHATTAARGVGRAMNQKEDIVRAQDSMDTFQQQLSELNEQFQGETAALQSKIDPSLEPLEPVALRPKKTDIAVQLLTLAWAPYRDGQPAW
jgi:hypothetical protein